MQSNYTLLQTFNAKGQMRIVIDDEVEALRLPVQSMRAAPSTASLATLSRGKSPPRGAKLPKTPVLVAVWNLTL